NVADGEAVWAGPDGGPLGDVIEGAVDGVAAPVVDDLELVGQLRGEAVDQGHLQSAGEVDVSGDDELSVLRAGGQASDLVVNRAGCSVSYRYSVSEEKISIVEFN